MLVNLVGAHQPDARAKDDVFLRWRFRLVCDSALNTSLSAPAKDNVFLRWRFRLVCDIALGHTSLTCQRRTTFSFAGASGWYVTARR